MKIRQFAIGIMGTLVTGTAVLASGLDTLVEDLQLNSSWPVHDVLSNVLHTANIELRVQQGALSDPKTGKPLECDCLARFRQAPVQDVLAWVLHVTCLSTTLSNGVLNVAVADGATRVPESLKIQPKPVQVRDLLSTTGSAKSVTLRKKAEWDPAQVLEFLCHKTGVPNYAIAPDVRGGPGRMVTVQFIDTPVADAMDKVLEDAGCESMVCRNTLFIRRKPKPKPNQKVDPIN